MSEGQLALGLRYVHALGAEDFLPAACNQEALAWLARWPDWPAPGLVLVGPEGSGKSHLARIFASRTDATRLDANHLPDPLPPGRTFVLDPADPVPDEAWLLSLHHAARERGGHLLLTAERPPARWPIGLPDLASRIRALPVATLGPPDDALLGALLLKLFRDRGLVVREGVIAYLVRHMERSFAAAHHLVADLDARSLQHKRPVTVPLARTVLGAHTPEEAEDGSRNRGP